MRRARPAGWSKPAMPYHRLKQRLDAGEVVILDGATGTEPQ